MVRVEFTIEPFVEGQPGEHVTSAIAAARDRGADVEVGPFGTVCDIADDRAGSLVEAVVDAAVAHGATHVSLHIEVAR